MKYITFNTIIKEHIKNFGATDDTKNYEIQFYDEEGNLLKPVYVRTRIKLLQIFLEKDKEE